MEGKEVKCTFKVVFQRVVMIAGIVAGALLAILGMVTITGDTTELFRKPFVQWYTTDVYDISFKEGKGFSTHDIWTRPHQFIRFQWTYSLFPVFVQECSDRYLPIDKGFKTKKTTQGSEKVGLSNMSITTHYFCVSHDDGYHCMGDSDYQGRIHMYQGTPFYANGVLGNQNYRFTFFMLACVTIIFGLIIILGELHIPFVTTKFTFFYYSFVKGIIYFCYGFLTMGMSNLFGLFVSIVMWLVGILNCVYGWRAITSFQWNKVGSRGTTTIVTRREYI